MNLKQILESIASNLFSETEVDSHIYARVTDGLTTDDSQVFKDFSDALEQDPSVEDAVYIKICGEDQVTLPGSLSCCCCSTSTSLVSKTFGVIFDRESPEKSFVQTYTENISYKGL